MNSKKLLILIGILLALGRLSAQDTLLVWPGDVNNNGVVNGVDVLYWSAAQGERGPKRPKEDTLWAAQKVVAWEGSFPDGTNYAYADADGNGNINEADLRIIRANFGLTREGIIPDLFINGIPDIDPPLRLRSRQPAVKKGEPAEFDVSLGDDVVQATDFFGITFTIPYDPKVANPNRQSAMFELEQNSWIGRLNADVKEFVVNDPEEGKTHIAIYRKKKEEVPMGEGQVGVYSIVVVEDIAVGLKAVDLGLEDTKMVDLNLDDMPVALDSTSVPIDEATSRFEPLGDDRRLIVYPNPAYDQITVEWTVDTYDLQRIELFNLIGQPLRIIRPAGERQLTVDLRELPAGLYILRVHTPKGIIAKRIVKEK